MHLPRFTDRPSALLAAALLLALVLVPAKMWAEAPAPDEPVRVVLPYMGSPLAISTDGRWVAAVHGEDIQLIDNNTRRVLWQVPSEYRIQQAAFAPDGKWLAVSDSQNIYRIDLDTGKKTVFLPNTSGRIVFHPDKPLLIILGYTTQPNIPLSEKLTLSSPDGVVALDPSNKPDDLPAMLRRPAFKDPNRKIQRFFYKERELALAAYNFEKNQWQYVLQTPVAALSRHALRDKDGKALPRGTDTLYIDGDRVYIYGVGGDLISRVTNTFPADACLDIETGEAWINFGLYERNRHGFGEEQVKPAFVYTPPDYLSQLDGVAEAYAEQQQKMLVAVQSLTPRPLNHARLYERDGAFIVHTPNRDTVQIATAVPTYTPGKDQWGENQRPHYTTQLGLLQLTRDGKLAGGSLADSGYGYAHYFNGRLVAHQEHRWQNTLVYHYKLVDLETDEVLVARHQTIKDSRNKLQVGETWIAGNGLVGRNEENGFDFFNSPKEAGPAWTFDQPEETSIGLVGASSDGSKLVMVIDHRGRGNAELPYRFETLILDSQTGDVLGRIQTEDHLNTCGVAFDAAQAHITVAEHWGDNNPTLSTYHVATGKKTESVILSRDKRMWCDLANMDEPVEFLQNFSPAKAPDRYRLSFGSRVISVRKVEALGQPAWLIIGRRNAHLFAIDDNEYLATFPYAEVKHSRRYSTRPRVTPIFNGNALLVSKGFTPGFDLIDLRTLETKLHVRLVTMSEGIGTVVYTPDGTWDATEQAEQYLSLYKGAALMDPQSAQRYRNPEKIAETIRALAR